MKKILAIVLAVLLMIPFAAFPALAEEACPEEEATAAGPMEAEEEKQEEPAEEACLEEEPEAAEPAEEEKKEEPAVETMPETEEAGPETSEAEGGTMPVPEETGTEAGKTETEPDREEPNAPEQAEESDRAEVRNDGEKDILIPPVIYEQPQDAVVTEGEPARFSAWADFGMVYQWQVSKDGGSTWRDCTSKGNNTKSMTFYTKLSYTGWMYRCRISNNDGEVVTDTALLTVKPVEYPIIEITRQPQDADVMDGAQVRMSIFATGGFFTYQWQVSKDGGATWKDCVSYGNHTDQMVFTAKPSYSGWMYRCLVSNLAETVSSDVATLTVTGIAPSITRQPEDISAPPGEAASFAVEVSGTALNIQWQKSKNGGVTWSNCTSYGSTEVKMIFTAQTDYNGWMYRCRVSNSLGTVYSDVVTLTVSLVRPSITEQPRDVTEVKGETVYFTCSASGGECVYQWQVSKDGGTTWKNCTSTGYNTQTLRFTAKMSYSGWIYRCRVTNGAGKVYTEKALLTVIPTEMPRFTEHLQDMTVAEGLKVHITVRAEGEELSYQWQVSKDGGRTWKNCTSAGFSTDTLRFTAAMKYSGWKYRCVVSNSAGEAVSREMTLTVQEPDGKDPMTAFPIEAGAENQLIWMDIANSNEACLQFTIPARGLFELWMSKPVWQDRPINFDIVISKPYDGGREMWHTQTYPQNDLYDDGYFYRVGLAPGVYVITFSLYDFDILDPVELYYGYEFTETSGWEIESNNYADGATKLVLDEPCVGIISETDTSPGDDWYRIRLRKDKRYALILDNAEELFEVSAEAEIYFNGVETSIVTGVSQTETTLVAVLEPDQTGDYYIRILQGEFGIGAAYAICVTLYEE